ncbi:MAG: ABC transporter substrate-binding protein [Methylococcales bacterium]|nr:ABC transporter substrate-binding protein [Methylococcales bacterium]
MLNKKSLLGFLSLLFLYANLVTANAAEPATANTAKQVVDEFQAVLIDTMKQGQQLGYQGRYDKLYPAITRSHDLTKIARIVIGKEWDTLTEKQQSELVDVFIRLSVASYAHNFKSFAGESFRFESEEQTSRGGIVVHTSLLIPDSKSVRFDYMLKEKTNGWSIINIIADGVSDLALKRSEYTSILKSQGFDVLIAQINEKILNYSKL